jgi:Ras family protein A
VICSENQRLIALNSRLSLGRKATSDGSLPKLRDFDQPFIFDIRMYNRPYRFEFYDTASPQNYTLIRADVLVLCYDISQRETLYSLKANWKRTIDGHFNVDERIPIVVVGLKRDLRKEWTREEQVAGVLGLSVMPDEGLRVAQEMRADKYAECSAITGELCQEVLEDISKTAAMTTTERGGRTDGGCAVM